MKDSKDKLIQKLQSFFVQIKDKCKRIKEKGKGIDIWKFLFFLFIFCACCSYFLFLYNFITVIIKYGVFSGWQPIVTNADKIGLGTIYLLIAYFIKKEKGEHF